MLLRREVDWPIYQSMMRNEVVLPEATLFQDTVYRRILHSPQESANFDKTLETAGTLSGFLNCTFPSCLSPATPSPCSLLSTRQIADFHSHQFIDMFKSCMYSHNRSLRHLRTMLSETHGLTGPVTQLSLSLNKKKLSMFLQI